MERCGQATRAFPLCDDDGGGDGDDGDGGDVVTIAVWE